MRLSRPFILAPVIYRDAVFRLGTTEKVICLTFDDGPDTGSTPDLLRIIERYGIKAVFFCTGVSAVSNPGLMKRIRLGGHLVGNHGYNHLNGFRTSLIRYTENVSAAAGLTSSGIFRPPYGFITPAQYHVLSGSYKIVFWDVMAYDFDIRFGKERSLKLIKDKMRKGSIIVLHNNAKSSAPFFLEEFIVCALSQGYRFEIPSILNQES